MCVWGGGGGRGAELLKWSQNGLILQNFKDGGGASVLKPSQSHTNDNNDVLFFQSPPFIPYIHILFHAIYRYTNCGKYEFYDLLSNFQ